MRSWFTPIFFSITVIGYGQYAIGLRSGPMMFGAIESGFKNVSNTSVNTFGIVAQEMPSSGNGSRFGLDAVIRHFDLDQTPNLREILSTKVINLQFSSEIRFALGDSSKWYFDFGPVIGATLLEEWTGVGVSTWDPDYPPVIYDHVQERDFEINDVRVRFGISKDFAINDHYSITAGFATSPGWAGWYRSMQYFTVDAQLFFSLQYLIKKPLKTPEQINDPIGYFPRNSRLTELMQKRLPVGGGPSSKMWPRCALHRPQVTSIRRMPKVLSS